LSQLRRRTSTQAAGWKSQRGVLNLAKLQGGAISKSPTNPDDPPHFKEAIDDNRPAIANRRSLRPHLRQCLAVNLAALSAAMFDSIGQEAFFSHCPHFRERTANTARQEILIQAGQRRRVRAAKEIGRDG